MSRKAFTLIELLMVVLIMGILGSVTVGGYRAMQRGMEERGVMENVNHFIRAAYRRAQVDRQPVAVFYWNELVRAETDTETKIVIGKAVAVRRAGRFSRVDGRYLCDEFADLDRERLVVDSNDENGTGSSDDDEPGDDNVVALYKMTSRNQASGEPCYVRQTTEDATSKNGDKMLSGMIEDIPCYAYYASGDGYTWHRGDAYGIEFAEIQLPNGYIFDAGWQMNQVGEKSSVNSIWFDVAPNTGSGARQGASGKMTVYSLRQTDKGDFTPEEVAQSEDPWEGIH